MPQRDYILRMIEQIGGVLAQLLRRIMGREISREELQRELQAVGRSLGTDFDLAHQVTPETMLMLISPSGDIEPGRCWVLGEMFYLEALDAKLAGDEGAAMDRLARAHLLFSAVSGRHSTLPGFPEAAERLRDIARLRDELDPP